MANSFPTLSLQIGLAANPLSTVPSTGWTTINSTDIRGPLVASRGRSRDLDNFNSGTITATLNNRKRKFDPENSTGPYYGNLIPDKPVRFRAAIGGTTYSLGYAYVNGFPQVYPEKGKDAVVPLNAQDGMKFLGLRKIGTPYDDIVIATSGLVAYWKMDSTGASEDNAASTATTLNGTYTTSTGLLRGATGAFYGKARTAVRFSTRSDYLSCSSNSSALPTNAISVEGWVQSTKKALITSWYEGGFRLSVQGASRAAFLLDENHDSGFIGVNLETTGVVADGAWHHLVGAWNGNTATLYLDGKVAAVKGYGGPIPYTQTATFVVTSGPGTGNVRLGVGDSLVITTTGRHLGGFGGAGRIDEVAIYNRAITAQEVSEHYHNRVDAFPAELSNLRIAKLLNFAGVSTSTNARALRTGQTTLQADDADNSSVLDYIQKCAQSENGQFFQAGNGKWTFHDRHYRITQKTVPSATFSDASTAALPYHDVVLDEDDQDVFNVISVGRDGGNTAIARSTSSITKHRERELNRTGLLMNSDNEAQSAAEWLRTRYATDTLQAKSITLNLTASTGMWAAVLPREIGDLIRIKRRPMSIGSTISKDFYIEGIRHEVDAAQNTWMTTFDLSPEDDTAYMIFGSTARGLFGTHRFGY